jgi:GrpB-like predicted nucleotidyltransferase (UPF0157 family)/GNAT superfamily N-acetyltransferase
MSTEAGQAKRIEVVSYDANWPEMFEVERRAIQDALGDNCIAIHHIGSTAVPGLVAKSKIDIIAVARDRKQAMTSLPEAGYFHRGEWNIPLKCGFVKRGSTNVNLHVFFDANHPEVELNLRFRDHLRTHPDVRDEYAAIKMKILQDEAAHHKVGKLLFPVYTIRKSGFIKGVMAKMGYDRLRVLKCTTDDEWETVKTFRQKYFFDTAGVQDPHCWTFDHPDHEHFILYRGVEIIGYAHVQLCPGSQTAILRVMVITENNRGQRFGSRFLSIIEEWGKVHDFRTIHTESPGGSLDFYKKHGYVEMSLSGLDQSPGGISLGKELGRA